MKKSNIFREESIVSCKNCGKNLLNDVHKSMIIIPTNEKGMIIDIIPCCKGECDDILSRNLDKRVSSGWKEFSEFVNPYLYLKHIIAVLNNQYEGLGFDNKNALENYKNLIISCYPYICRDLEDKDIQEATHSEMFPF